MNLMEDVDTIAATLELPDELATSPWNQQVTTKVADVVRAIYTQHMGENNYNAATLAMQGLIPTERASRLLDDLGGARKAISKAENAMQEHTLEGARWAAYLAYSVLLVEPDNSDAAEVYRAALKQVAFASTSAYERNLLLNEAQTYE